MDENMTASAFRTRISGFRHYAAFSVRLIFVNLWSEILIMKKIIIALALLPMFAIAQEKGKAFKLTGKSSNLAHTIDWVYLQYRTGGEWKTDSVKAQNGSYKFSGVIDEASMSRLRVSYIETEPGKKIKMVGNRDVATIYIQPGKISVTSVDSFSNVKVKGSVAHTEYTKLMAQVKPYSDKV